MWLVTYEWNGRWWPTWERHGSRGDEVICIEFLGFRVRWVCQQSAHVIEGMVADDIDYAEELDDPDCGVDLLVKHLPKLLTIEPDQREGHPLRLRSCCGGRCIVEEIRVCPWHACLLGDRKVLSIIHTATDVDMAAARDLFSACLKDVRRFEARARLN